MRLAPKRDCAGDGATDESKGKGERKRTSRRARYPKEKNRGTRTGCWLVKCGEKNRLYVQVSRARREKRGDSLLPGRRWAQFNSVRKGKHAGSKGERSAWNAVEGEGKGREAHESKLRGRGKPRQEE